MQDFYIIVCTQTNEDSGTNIKIFYIFKTMMILIMRLVNSDKK